MPHTEAIGTASLRPEWVMGQNKPMTKPKKIGIPFREGDFLLTMREDGGWRLRRIDRDTVDADMAGSETLPGLSDLLRRLKAREARLQEEVRFLESELEPDE